jgi:PAS domain-containing protein
VLSSDQPVSLLKRKLLEEALQDLKFKYSAIAEGSDDSVERLMYTDLIKYCNELLQDLVGGIVS